jgi:hypothetical protein
VLSGGVMGGVSAPTSDALPAAPVSAAVRRAGSWFVPVGFTLGIVGVHAHAWFFMFPRLKTLFQALRLDEPPSNWCQQLLWKFPIVPQIFSVVVVVMTIWTLLRKKNQPAPVVRCVLFLLTVALIAYFAFAIITPWPGMSSSIR